MVRFLKKLSLRNPFLKLFVIGEIFTREMKNPFEFTKSYCGIPEEELSKEEEKGIEQVLLEVEGMNTLVGN